MAVSRISSHNDSFVASRCNKCGLQESLIETVSQLESGIPLHLVADMGLKAAGGGDFVHHARILQRHLVSLDDGFTR